MECKRFYRLVPAGVADVSGALSLRRCYAGMYSLQQRNRSMFRG